MMDDKQKRLTAKPDTVEFWQELLDIAKGSDHPIDKRLVPILERELAEAAESGDGS